MSGRDQEVFWTLVYRAVTLLVFVALLIVLGMFVPAASALGPDDYDGEIRGASDRWLPGWDWTRYKAQLYQESLLDPNAVSPVGARGIAQFMPRTWREVAPALGYDGLSPHVAGPAIEAGAYYLARQMQTWTEPRPSLEVRRLGEAGYNAGTGNIIRAQWRCRNTGCGTCGGMCRSWADIRVCLHLVTGHHSRETITYVSRIERWWAQMRVRR